MSGAAAVAAVAEPQDARAVLRQAIAARQAARAKLADAEQAAKRSETMLKAIEAEIAKSSSAIESDTADEVASQIRDGSEAGQLSPALADRRRQRDELLEQAGRLRSAQKRLAADVETARAALQRSEVAAIESAEQILIDEAVERVARIEAALGTLKRDGTMLAGLCAIRLGASGMAMRLIKLPPSVVGAVQAASVVWSGPNSSPGFVEAGTLMWRRRLDELLK